MVKIPEKQDPTISAIYAAEEARVREVRSYVGASAIGEECARKIWYNLKFPVAFSASTLFAFEDGHRTEELVIERLRRVEGIEVWDKDGSGQIGFVDGEFKGHVDGVVLGLIQAPKTPHVLEIKCSKKLNEFRAAKSKHGEKSALENWNHTYYVQAQIYMHYLNLNRHYTIVASPGGRDMDSCRTEYMEDVALKYIDRAHKLIEAKDPPPQAYNNKDFFKCKWCDHRDRCWE